MYAAIGQFAVVAHRGGAAEHPENSPTALLSAPRRGATHVETDVHATRDGVIIAFHDLLLDRTTSGHGPLAARTHAELQDVHHADGSPLLTLAELLAGLPTTPLSIDVKAPGALAGTLALIAEHDATDRVVLGSFDEQRVHAIRAHDQRLQTTLTRREVIHLLTRPGHPVPDHPGPLLAAIPVRAGPIPVFSRRLLARAHAHGIPVHVWTVNDTGAMGRLRGMGADGLITDELAALAAIAGTNPPAPAS